MTRPITCNLPQALDHALDLFWARGYRGVSVDDIVKSTGLNRHTLYVHYGSKFGLAREALRRYCDESLRRLGDVLGGCDSPTERLRRFMRLRASGGKDAWWANMIERGCFALRMSTEMRTQYPEINSIVAGGVASIVRLLVDVIREGQASGEFLANRRPEGLAVVVYSTWLVALLMPPDSELEASVLSVLT